MNNKQNFTSANTSINANKLPTAFTKFKPYGHVLDYGCGKYYEKTKAHCDKTCLSYHPYDKYNCPDKENDKSINFGIEHGFDTIYCCNVLNVIDNDDVVWEILYKMFMMLNHHSKMYIQIYEGNRSGKGKATKNDCYQRNAKTEYYECFFSAFQGAPFTYKRTGNIITVIKH